MNFPQFKASSVHLLSSCVAGMGTLGGSNPFCEREQGGARSNVQLPRDISLPQVQMVQLSAGLLQQHTELSAWNALQMI